MAITYPVGARFHPQVPLLGGSYPASPLLAQASRGMHPALPAGVSPAVPPPPPAPAGALPPPPVGVTPSAAPAGGGGGGLLGRLRGGLTGLQNRPGGFLGLNPMTYMGLGLLSQGPSLTPQSPWAGLGHGLNMYQAAVQADRERQEFEAEQAEREAKARAALQSKEGYETYVSSLPEPVANALGGREALIALGPERGMSLVAPHLKPAPAPTTHAPVKVVGPDGSLQWVTREEAIGQPAPEPSPAVTVQTMPGPTFRATPGGGTSLVTVSPEGEPTTTPIIEGVTEGEKVAQRAEAQAQDAFAEGTRLIDAYEIAAGDERAWIPGTVEFRAAKNARQTLVAWYAKNVLGKPGTEPSPALYEQARELVADFAGPIDSRQFAGNVQAMRDQIGARFGAEVPEPDFVPGAEAGEGTVTGTEPGVRRYNPVTGRLE